MAGLIDTLTNKKFDTRIALKYDTFANWTAKDPVLLAGEIALATVPAGTATTPAFQNLPNVVAKVGDGVNKYSALPFLSALSADVYEWAKASIKPLYNAAEIADSEVYRLNEYETGKYRLEVATRNVTVKDGKYTSTLGNYTPVGEIALNLGDLDSRLKALEALLKSGEGDDTIPGQIAALQALINTINGNDAGKSMREVANAVVGAIDVGDSAVEGQYVSAVSQSSGSIFVTRANLPTLSKGTSAAATEADSDFVSVVSGTTASGHTVTDVLTSNIATKVKTDKMDTAIGENKAAIEAEVKARKEAITGLTVPAVSTSINGANIGFISEVSQANGVVGAKTGNIALTGNYNAETNKVATEDYVISKVADLTGAMHFEGFVEGETFEAALTASGKTFVAGDIVIYGITEYVYDGSAWQKLGDEGAIAAALKELNLNQVNVGEANTLSFIKQANGRVSVETVAIKIAESQVTGLEDDLAALAKDISDEATTARAAEKANADAIIAINGSDTGKSMRTVAADEATKALKTLNSNDSAAAGKYVSGVTLTNGVISVSETDLPTLSDSNAAATAATAESVTLLATLKAEGHTVSTTAYNNIATKVAVDRIDDEIDKIEKNINDMGGSVNASSAAATSATDYKVLTEVSASKGSISGGKSLALAKSAVTGKIDDMEQTNYIVFNCGDATNVI